MDSKEGGKERSLRSGGRAEEEEAGEQRRNATLLRAERERHKEPPQVSDRATPPRGIAWV